MLKRDRNSRFILRFWVYFFCQLFLLSLANAAGITHKSHFDLNRLVGNRDGVLIAGEADRPLYAKNENRSMVPASTLKILTSLIALKHLGPDYRFKTEFYLDSDQNLKIKGYGDPLLLSETISSIVQKLKRHLKQINGILLDDSYFATPLKIPGITSSYEPYDAPNGALCANFNTVSFKRIGKRFFSAEPQTPLLSVTHNRIRSSNRTDGRISLSNNSHEATLYVGHLFNYFLEKSGIPTKSKVGLARVDKRTDRLIFTHVSRYSMTQIISNLMTYSNNFIANQLLIASGAATLGGPGTLDKGVRLALEYTRQKLGINNMAIVEGSGISRKNRLSAADMHRILVAFKPYRTLMRPGGNERYKTGSLSGIRTRAGYIETARGRVYPYALFLNTPGKNTDSIMKILLRIFN